VDLSSLVDNKIALALVSAVAGGLVAFFVRQITNRRGVVSYCVDHAPLGISTEDAIFGTVEVLWNKIKLANLFSSHVEVENVSSQDFENVEVRLYTVDGELLTERVIIDGSTQVIKHSDDFAKSLTVTGGQQPTEDQWRVFRHSRHYMLPVMNRGQRTHFHLLSTAPAGQRPNIWCDILHKGLKVKFYERSLPIFMGVPLKSAAWVCTVLNLVFLACVIAWVETAWIAAVLVWALGLVSLCCGALLIRALRKIRTVCSN